MNPIIPLLLLSITWQQQPLTERPCNTCHTADHWVPLADTLAFNHADTVFPLTGGHREADCIQCHGGITVTEIHQFQRVNTACNSCHMDIHYSEFGEDCRRCHTTDSWVMDDWWNRHEGTLFSLTGAHRLLPCGTCHGSGFDRLRGNLSTDCYDCHQGQFRDLIVVNNGHPDNSDCIFCHNTRAWQPLDMSHHDLLFPIYSGKHKGKWSTCEAECHLNPADYSDFSCGLDGICHEHRRTKMDSEHREVRDYVYESAACFNCHPDGGEEEGD